MQHAFVLKLVRNAKITVYNLTLWTYSQEQNSTYDCCLLKQNCYFQRGMAKCKHAVTPLRSYSQPWSRGHLGIGFDAH